jgi:hypothetical protein
LQECFRFFGKRIGMDQKDVYGGLTAMQRVNGAHGNHLGRGVLRVKNRIEFVVPFNAGKVKNEQARGEKKGDRGKAASNGHGKYAIFQGTPMHTCPKKMLLWKIIIL